MNQIEASDNLMWEESIKRNAVGKFAPEVIVIE